MLKLFSLRFRWAESQHSWWKFMVDTYCHVLSKPTYLSVGGNKKPGGKRNRKRRDDGAESWTADLKALVRFSYRGFLARRRVESQSISSSPFYEFIGSWTARHRFPSKCTPHHGNVGDNNAEKVGLSGYPSRIEIQCTPRRGLRPPTAVSKISHCFPN